MKLKKNKIVPKNTKPAKLNVLAGFAWSWWTDSNPRPADYKSVLIEVLTFPICLKYAINQDFMLISIHILPFF